jgi:SAM-dependent methyltransferase
MSEVKTIGETFGAYYDGSDGGWGHGSGPGSDPFYTIAYRAFLEKFYQLNRVKSIVDIGCGDWQFSRFLNFDGVDYLGLDVVPLVVDRNSRAFARSNVKFSLMPENNADIPGADLLIMKDVLQHLPIPDIIEFYKDVFPKFKYCLITNSFQKIATEVNHEILPGEFRCLDLAAPPFNFRGSYIFDFFSPAWEEIRTFLIMR